MVGQSMKGWQKSICPKMTRYYYIWVEILNMLPNYFTVALSHGVYCEL